jgi:sugar O-acyltransferase (sialic acid O-acetyltransferase NeuD family)
MDVVIIGAGGAGREVYWTFLDDNQERRKWNVLGFVDESPSLKGGSVCNLPVLGDFRWLSDHARQKFAVICAIGNPERRKQLIDRAGELGFTFCTVVHPSVKKSQWVDVGPGSIICAATVLTTQVQIAAHVIVNVGCTISHDTRISAYCNINPGCHIAGAVQIGEGVDLGAGSVVIQNRMVGEWSMIGAGAVVTTDIPARVTAVGIPCRVIKHHQPELSVAVT